MSNFTKEQVKSILENNGIDSEYLENNDNEVIGGTEEWMDVIGEITDTDPYNDKLDPDDLRTIDNFIRVMENELNIPLN